MSRARFLVLAAFLLAGVGVSFGFVANPFRATGHRPPSRPLGDFPREIEDGRGIRWTGEDRALPKKAVNIAGMDSYLRRDYRSADGRTVQLFVSYYGNLGAGIDTIYHNPTVCFPSHGWKQEGEWPVAAGEGEGAIPATMYRFTKGTREFVVLNLFVVNGRRLGQSPREAPLELARQKFTLTSDPGYYAQIQVIADGGAGNPAGRDTALAFLAAAGPRLFAHF